MGVAVAGGAANHRPAERVQQADAFRRPEGQVEGEHPLAVWWSAKPRRGVGVGAGQHPQQAVFADLAGYLQLGGGRPGPVAWRLASAGVVLLLAAGDLVEVVALLATQQLADVEHRSLPRYSAHARREPRRASR